MKLAERKLAVNQLKTLAGYIWGLKIKDPQTFRNWARKNEQLLNDIFLYRREGEMPPIYSLVSPFYHPEYPLVGFNYTIAAHNLLYKFPLGWTPVLRCCRGIMLDHEDNLVAFPFYKFFNYGEHPETKKLPEGPYEATDKLDGHLGIIFKYKGNFIIATRGSFTSNTAKIAQGILYDYAALNNWEKRFPGTMTLLVEIIHPQTKVLLDYGSAEKFVAIGAFNRNNLREFNYSNLAATAFNLGMETAEFCEGLDAKELLDETRDDKIKDREGYVLSFRGGLKIKLKFKSYVGRMISGNILKDGRINYPYLLNRIIEGDLEEKLKFMPEEISTRIFLTKEAIEKRLEYGDTQQGKWTALYGIAPKESQTAYFKERCRELVKIRFPNLPRR